VAAERRAARKRWYAQWHARAAALLDGHQEPMEAARFHAVEQRAVDERARHHRVSSRNPRGGRRRNQPRKHRARW